MEGLKDLIIYHVLTFSIAGFHVHLLHHDVMMSIAMGMLGSVGYFLYKNMSEEVKAKRQIKIAFIIMLLLILVG